MRQFRRGEQVGSDAWFSENSPGLRKTTKTADSKSARRRSWRLVAGIVRRRRECAAPASGAQAGVLLERSVEMALAREAAERGDFRQCEIRSFKEPLRLAH